MTTPDYIKARAEALFPPCIIETKMPMGNTVDIDISEDQRAAYIKGCTDTLEGSAGNWKDASEMPDLCEDDDWSDLLIIGVVAASDNEIPFVTTGKYYNGNWYLNDGDEPIDKVFKVTKWMPLPEYESVPYTPLREVCEGLAKALEEIIKISDRKHDAWDAAKQQLDSWKSLNKERQRA